MLREPPGFSRSPLVEDPRVRFFVITSNLGENVVKSVEHNVWATQRKNEDALTDAFLHSKAVILIFSVNKSGAFQGYARMRGLPGRSKCRSNPFGGYGRMFDVEWLRLQDVVMPEVSYLRNSLDGGREVGYARDGQELPAAVGAELCRHFDVRVYLEDPNTYEPCVDDPQPVLPPPVRGADSTPRPGPPPAIPPPHQPAHELPYHWPAPGYGYPGPAPAGHPPPPQGYPPPTSPFSVAPSGLPPPWAVPPGAWLGHSGRHSRRRRRHRRRSSSYSQSPGRSSKRQRGSDRKEEALPDFTKMTHEEYVEWWKKTHPTAPANAAAASPPAEGVVEPSPPAPQASAPVPVSPFQVAAAPAIQDPALAEPVQAAAEAVPAPATCFERSDPPVSVAAAAPAEPAKPPKEKKKKKKEAEAAAKAAAAPPTAANGAAPVEPKPVKEKKAKKDKKEKKQKKNKEKTIVLNGDAEISGKDVVAPGEVSPPSSAGAPEAVVVAEMPEPIQANGKEISAAVAAVPQSMNSSVAAAARESASPSPKGKDQDVAAAAQSPPMATSGDATAPVAAPKSILRKSQASSAPSASEPPAPTAVAPASASTPPQPKSILRRPQATEVVAAVQKPQEAVRQPGLDTDPRLVGAVKAPAADKSKERDDDDDSESTMSFESDIEIESNTGGDAMLIDDGYGSASD